jgi:membrane-associated phospholipid phosphatase
MSELFGWRDVCYITPALIASGVAGTASEVSPYPAQTGTAMIHGLEGETVALFQQVVHPVLTQFFIGVYLLLYPALLLGTYLVLKQQDRKKSLDYVFTYTAVVIASIPFFYFVPVGVTGYYLDSVTPLLYTYEGIGGFMNSVDTLNKAFPSLHAGLAMSATLYAPEGYEKLSWAITGVIVLATLYLGVHWLSDVALGVALTYTCYRLTPRLFSHWRSWSEERFSTLAGQ